MFQLVVRGFRNDSLFQMVMALKKLNACLTMKSVKKHSI